VTLPSPYVEWLYRAISEKILNCDSSDINLEPDNRHQPARPNGSLQMKKIVSILFASLFLLALGTTAASAAPESAPANHGQCVSSSDKPTGDGGRSEIAKDKSGCPAPLTCTATGTVSLDSATNTVKVTGTGPNSAGSSLECTTSIAVTAGQQVTFNYLLGDGAAPCGGGVPRMFVQIDGTYYNTIDSNPECAGQAPGTVTYTIPVTGTVTSVGFVYDRGDFGSATYTNATVGGVVLDI
jgi:hypothetical protein